MLQERMPVQDLRDYRYRGARALVLLHERALRHRFQLEELMEAGGRGDAPQAGIPTSRALSSHSRRAAASSREDADEGTARHLEK